MKTAKMMVLTAALLAGASAARTQVQFNDGQTHFIDYDIEDNVYIDYESPGMGTTVNFTDARLWGSTYAHHDSRVNATRVTDSWEIAAYDNAMVNFAESYVRHLDAHDNAMVNFTESDVRSLYAHDNAMVNFTDGDMGGVRARDNTTVGIINSAFASISALGNSRVNIVDSEWNSDQYIRAGQSSLVVLNNVSSKSGQPVRLEAQGNSTVVINGVDSLAVQARDNPHVILNSGIIDHLETLGGRLTVNGGQLSSHIIRVGNLNLYGGVVERDLEVDNELFMSGGVVQGDLRVYGELFMHGGVVQGTLWARAFAHWAGGIIEGHIFNSSGELVIAGYDFALDGQSLEFGEFTDITGTLTGTLASGEVIDNFIQVSHGGSLVLVPEPATVALLGLGLLLVAKKRS